MSTNCAYLGELVNSTVHHCLLRQQPCTAESGKGECALRLQLDDPAFAQKFTDPLIIIDRQRTRTETLRGILAGGAAFLIGGGPSANDLPLELLAKRGIWSLAVNNSAGHPRIRPQAFVCSDPPSKFSHSIWLDPGIMKFVPSPKMSGRRAHLRRRTRRGFRGLKRTVTQCPNVWGFQRNSWEERRVG